MPTISSNTNNLQNLTFGESGAGIERLNLTPEASMSFLKSSAPLSEHEQSFLLSQLSPMQQGEVMRARASRSGGNVVYGDDIVVTAIVNSAYWNGREIFEDFEAWSNYLEYVSEKQTPEQQESQATASAADTADREKREVKVNTDRPLTPEEQKAVDKLRSVIAQVDGKIALIPNTWTMTLPGGRIITGAEIKENWSKVDFTIKPDIVVDGKRYQGGADWNGGNPEIALNIAILAEYNADYIMAGVEYVVLHDLSHFSRAQRDQNTQMKSDGNYTETERLTHEREANDIARALASLMDIQIDPKAVDGYTPTSPESTEPSAPYYPFDGWSFP